MNNFKSTFKAFDDNVSKQEQEISGTLGVYLSGEKLVDVPNRPGFVYVQLRDNQSEVIQVFNETVSTIFGLAVIVIRQGNRYIVKGRDTERYNNWGSSSSFVPVHANQHAFNPDGGGGGDILWVQGRQMMPLAVFPSGTHGSDGVMLYPYQYRQSDGTIINMGTTGTGDLVQYKPTDDTAIMGVIYTNTSNGNPEFLLNSGTFFAASITGTSDITQYLPTVENDDFLLLAGIRLVSGTSVIGWDNIYDLRQWHSISATIPDSTILIEDEGTPQGSADTLNFVGDNVEVSVTGDVARVYVTGSSGGGGGTPGGSSTQVQYNHSGTFAGDSGFLWHKDSKNLAIGEAVMPVLPTDNKMNVVGVTGTAGFIAWTAKETAGHGGYFGSIRARGDWTTPTALQTGDNILRIRGWGYDDSNQGASNTEIRFVAEENYTTSHHGSSIEFWATPTGTVTKQLIGTISETGFALVTGTSFTKGDTINSINSFGVSRKLIDNLTLEDTKSLIVSEYFDVDAYVLDMQGDSVLEII
ncbi:hypothetical protein HN803_02390 [candidate division WWE3 bacterium]|nr:hypothetical protein [candidate division WWE3 bacterium]